MEAADAEPASTASRDLAAAGTAAAEGAVASRDTGRRPFRRAAGLWCTGIGALLASVAVLAMTNHFEDPIVLGSFIPRASHLAGVLAALGVAGVAAGSYTRLYAEDRGRLRPRGLLRRTAIVMTTVASLLASTAALLVIGLFYSFTHFHILTPSGLQGCRVVVAENDFGYGRVFVLPAGAHRPLQVNTYTSDDTYRPVALGTYRLTWTGATADLALWGTGNAQVTYQPVPLTCPS